MSETSSATPRLQVARVQRTPIDLASRMAVQTRPLDEGAALPLLVTPVRQGLEATAWAARNTAWIAATLLEHGAILCRGFTVRGLSNFEEFMRAVNPVLLEYKERSTPRTRVGAAVYTSTEYPAHLDIPQHNENSYATTWPRQIAFYCQEPAAHGGETPLADSRGVFQRIPSRVRDAFTRHGVMYVRNYGHGVDLSWPDAFQTTNRGDVERYCASAAIACEWLDGGRRLRTRQVRPAIARHPETREWLWFNQAHLFHTSSLDEVTREALHATYADEDLPRQSFFGDGAPIPVAVLDEVREAYRQSLRVFPWTRGDLLLLDNMLVSHGRRAFSGSRQVLVTMAGPCQQTN